MYSAFDDLLQCFPDSCSCKLTLGRRRPYEKALWGWPYKGFKRTWEGYTTGSEADTARMEPRCCSSGLTYRWYSSLYKCRQLEREMLEKHWNKHWVHFAESTFNVKTQSQSLSYYNFAEATMSSYISDVGVWLALSAPTKQGRNASLAFTASLLVQFCISGTYHTSTWKPTPRVWLRRADHAAIFLLIAGMACQ